MDILFATNHFLPTHTAGTETYTYGLAQACLRMGHSVRVLCVGTFGEGASHIPQVTTDEVDGIAVTRLHFNWQRARDIFMELADNTDVGRWFAGYLRAQRPDILHVTSCDTLSPSVITVAKAQGIPVIVTLTDFWFLCMRHTLLKGDGTLCNGPENPWGCLQCLAHNAKIYTLPQAVLPERVVRAGLTWASTKPLITRQRGVRGVLGDVPRRQETVLSALQKADVIISPSQFLKTMFERNGFPEGRIVVSRHGHDHGWLPADTNKVPAPSVRIGYLGQIEPFKGVDLLVRAVRGIPESSITLGLYGDHHRNEPYTTSLRALSNNDPRIRFMGPYTRTERGTILRNLDVIVVPSRWYENAPAVIAEAFAMQTPVITANLGGMAEAVCDEVDGLHFAADDEADLARQLQRIIDDPSILTRLREGIQMPRAVADEADVLDALYRQILQTTGRGSSGVVSLPAFRQPSGTQVAEEVMRT